MKNIKYLLVLTAIFTILACNKTEGEGGTSTIEGKILTINLNNDGETISQYYAMDEDVFIIYGESSTVYNDKTSTSFDGKFRFNNLMPGKYTIFAYSQCDACPSGEEVMTKTIEITDKNQVIVMDDLIIFT